MSSKDGKGAVKTGKALVSSASIAPVAKSASDTADKCKVCAVTVGNDDAALACEICENWFHIKCEAMSEDEYAFLDAHKSLHWYCTVCNKNVATTITLFHSLKQKVDNMETKLD